jgi:hypothetical protein
MVLSDGLSELAHFKIGPYTSIAFYVLLLILSWNKRPSEGAKFLGEGSQLCFQLLIYMCFY